MRTVGVFVIALVALAGCDVPADEASGPGPAGTNSTDAADDENGSPGTDGTTTTSATNTSAPTDSTNATDGPGDGGTASNNTTDPANQTTDPVSNTTAPPTSPFADLPFYDLRDGPLRFEARAEVTGFVVDAPAGWLASFHDAGADAPGNWILGVPLADGRIVAPAACGPPAGLSYWSSDADETSWGGGHDDFAGSFLIVMRSSEPGSIVLELTAGDAPAAGRPFNDTAALGDRVAVEVMQMDVPDADAGAGVRQDAAGSIAVGAAGAYVRGHVWTEGQEGGSGSYEARIDGPGACGLDDSVALAGDEDFGGRGYDLWIDGAGQHAWSITHTRQIGMSPVHVLDVDWLIVSFPDT